MRYMIIVKATAETEAAGAPAQTLNAALHAFHRELGEAGVLRDLTALHPSSEGWRIQYEGDGHEVVSGPFGEPTDIVAGYTVIEVATREAAIEWSRRFPNPAGNGVGEIEVRALFELAPPEPIDPAEIRRRMALGEELPE